MKICVYAIAKNEEQNIEGWYESAKDADQLVLLDTGSDDDTYDMSRRLGIETYRAEIVPWRFDDARNKALSYVSPDIDFCIALDLDERLLPGWKEAFKEVNLSTTRIKYRMAYLRNGEKMMWYWANRCHARHGYHWEYGVHEKPIYNGEEIVQLLDFDTHHIPDEDKPRNYLEMLEDLTKHFPERERYAIMYARELLFYEHPIKAYAEFQRYLHIGNPTWQEYADVYRYMGHCQISPVADFEKSLEYAPRRETYIDLAKYYNDRNEWVKCLDYCDKAFAIKEYPTEFTSFLYAWGPLSYSMASMAAMNLGEYGLAKHYIDEGLRGGSNERLLNNLKLIQVNEMLSMV
jgi:glycosyltransferase involved in cell wall biosynthesis